MERFLEYFVPEKYVLNIGIDKFNKKIGGVVIVSGEVKTETVKLHAVDLNVTQVFVNGKELSFKNENNVLSFCGLELGKAEILIVYDGNLNENMEGAYLSTYKYGDELETIVATQFESHYARQAFPCIDEPEAKAVFDLSLTVPAVDDEVVLSNMQVEKTKKYYKVPDGKYTVFYDDEGKKSASSYIEYYFESTPRMSTYLLAWVVGRLHGKTVTNKHGVEITTYCALNQNENAVNFANEVAARSLEFYDDNFGIKYPLKKLTQVALPDFEAGAMENWGLVTYRESMLLASEDATLGTRKGIALTVAHELSHQWFGDLVTMKWWDDLWLNESFASVMEYYAVDAIYPEFRIWESFFTGDALAALNRDAYTDVQSVHQEVHSPEEIATLFDGAIVYSKGARLMLMLIRLMGWEDFCKGIRDYFEKYAYSNTVGDDLWVSLKPYAQFDPNKLMHAFIDRPGYPVISDGKQKRFVLDGEMEDFEWPIPEVMEDMSGHYILKLSDEEFESRLSRFDELSLEEKLRLLIDRNLLSKAGLISPASLIPLIEKFKDETSAAVWNIILSIVSGLKVFFDFDSEEEKRFKKFVGELVAPGLLRLGLKTRKDDDENVIRLRAILLALDFYAETKKNLRELASMYNEHYEKIDSEIRNDVLDAKVYLEPEVVDTYIRDYQKVANPEIKSDLLFAGTLAKNKQALDMMTGLLNQPEVVKPQDQLYLFIYLYRNPRVRDEVFAWLTRHWDYVSEMVGDKSLENYPRYTANVIRTEAEYQAWQDFFGSKSDEPSLSRAIKIGQKEIDARLKLIRENQEEVFRVI